MIGQRHYLTAVHDIAQAWTGIGAAAHALWQQTKVASSTWTMLGVVSYLACVSTLQTASTTIMQFIAFDSYSTIPIQSAITWPNATTLANMTLPNSLYQSLPPSSFLSNIQTIGLLNNTLYDILTTTDSSFTKATLNATSLQSYCGLLSNLTFNSSIHTLSFSDNGFGFGSFVLLGDIDGMFLFLFYFFKLKIIYCGLLMALHNLQGAGPLIYPPSTRNQIIFLIDDITNPNVIIIFSFCNIIQKKEETYFSPEYQSICVFSDYNWY